MPWRQRGQNRAFYQSLRINGRVVHRYLGSGPEAARVAAVIEERRQQRAAARAVLLAEQQTHGQVENPLEAFCSLTDLLVRATLLLAGYHQHCRGAWRKTRRTHS
jgi:hypothetical protein